MKKSIIFLLLAAIIGVFACNNSGDSKIKSDVSKVSRHKVVVDSVKIKDTFKTITKTFPHVDLKLRLSITAIVDNYLNLKNSLADDNSVAAKQDAKLIDVAMFSLDTIIVNPVQKKAYGSREQVIKEDVQMIMKNELPQQRKYFQRLSQSVFSLAKDFGGERILYLIECDKVRLPDGKAAMWISENKKLNNPYLGKKDTTCAKIIEKISM